MIIYIIDDFRVGNRKSNIKNLHHISVTIFSILFLIQIVLGVFNYIKIYIEDYTLRKSNVFETKRIHMVILFLKRFR